jgi:uncharacterized protein (TIGR02145 family)
MKTKIVFHFLMIMLILMTVCCKKKSDDSSSAITVKDIDGNVYHTVTIGTQTWTVENLKVTHYRNGDPIQFVADSLAWGGLKTGAYCDYQNSVDLGSIYGHLYNWYTVSDNRHICPAGWHVPTDDEWTTLIVFLGDVSVAGGKMKETGTAHWASPNAGATNTSGFTALPGGYRSYTSEFASPNNGWGYWWSSTGDGFTSPIRVLYFSSAGVMRLLSATNYACSVRLVKD